MKGLNWLVTGGSGALAKALTSHLLADYEPRRIALLSRGEAAQAAMRQSFIDPRLRWLIGDVRDGDRLKDAFQEVDVVIHAAALKRIDTVAQNPDEAVSTNVWGTWETLKAARDVGVPKVLLISTDKAVAPSTHYGSTKQMAEFLTVGANTYGYAQGTISSAVRYGNVIGSTGSVVPIWKAAVQEGKPIPLTDPDMTRFWFTLEQAAQLVTFAVERMEGGEIFVPLLKGSTVGKLAAAIAPHHTVQMVGGRGTEKQHESLLAEEELPRTRIVDNHFVVYPDRHVWRDTWVYQGEPVGDLPPYRSDVVSQYSVEELRALCG